MKFLQGNPGNPLPLKNNYHFWFYLILKKQNLSSIKSALTTKKDYETAKTDQDNTFGTPATTQSEVGSFR